VVRKNTPKGYRSETKTISYDGMIGCVTLPTTHLLFVRRNGRVTICGNTGEQGTVMRYVKKSKLADLVLKPLTKKLLAVGYCGCVDVNCIITDDGTPWPLEFTMRDGWPARRNTQALIQNKDPCQWMLDLVNGEDTIELVDGLICVSIVVTIPPYPHKEGGDEVDGKPIYGYDKNHVHLCDVRLGDNVPVPAGDGVIHIPSLVTAGEYVAVICGTGKTLSGARRSALAATEKFKVKHKQYRNEIGGKMAKQLPEIQKHGYATNLEI
jgi:phosphoribosylamine--glycine ligase